MVSMPNIYPYHARPIDNGWRPVPKELASIFNGKILYKTSIEVEHNSDKYENMPYTVVESLAMGKIVMASRIGGIPDLISDKKNGFLFEMGNSKDLAEKIKKLEDFDLEKISREAKESVSQLSLENYHKNSIFELCIFF